jgi:hypothetical protein
MKSKLAILVCLLASIAANAQTNKDTSDILFGFFLGSGISNVNVTTANWNQPPANYGDSLNSISSKNGIPLDFGGFFVLKLNKWLNIRESLFFSSNNTRISYNEKQGSVTTLKPRSNTAIGLTSAFKIDLTKKKIKPYLLLGATYLYKLGESNTLERNRIDVLAYALGCGVEIPTKHFKVSPEINYEGGIVNINRSSPNLYTNTISNLYQQRFMLSVYFSK